MTLGRDRFVSLATVLLALAGGVVLGGGPLQGDDPAASTGNGAPSSSEARSQGASGKQAETFDEAYLRATAPALLGDRLEGRTVSMVTLPGADPTAVGAVRELVGVAGGAVTAEARVRPELLDVGNRQLVAELARQTQETAGTRVRAAGATGYELTGRLLGHALLDGEDGGAPTDATGENILAGLTTARLLSTAEPVTRRGSLVLVVAGTPNGSADQREGAGSIVAALAEGLEGSGDGVVLAGPVAAGAPDGVVAAVRTTSAREDVSTVDALDSRAGAVVAVRALAAEADGVTGHYGAKAPDGVLPPS